LVLLKDTSWLYVNLRNDPLKHSGHSICILILAINSAICPWTLLVSLMILSINSSHILHSIKRLVFLMEVQWFLYEVATKLLNI
jgi:hypothetical protein